MPIHVMNNAARLTILEKRIEMVMDSMNYADSGGDYITARILERRLQQLESEYKLLNSGPDKREE